MMAAEVDTATRAVGLISLDAGGDEQNAASLSPGEQKNDPTEEQHRASLAKISSLIVSLRGQLNPAALQKAELGRSIEELSEDIDREEDETEKTKLEKELKQTKRKLRELRRNPPTLTAEEKKDINDEITAAEMEREEIKAQLAALQQQRQQPLPDAHQPTAVVVNDADSEFWKKMKGLCESAKLQNKGNTSLSYKLSCYNCNIFDMTSFAKKGTPKLFKKAKAYLEERAGSELLKKRTMSPDIIEALDTLRACDIARRRPDKSRVFWRSPAYLVMRADLLPRELAAVPDVQRIVGEYFISAIYAEVPEVLDGLLDWYTRHMWRLRSVRMYEGDVEKQKERSLLEPLRSLLDDFTGGFHLTCGETGSSATSLSRTVVRQADGIEQHGGVGELGHEESAIGTSQGNSLRHTIDLPGKIGRFANDVFRRNSGRDAVQVRRRVNFMTLGLEPAEETNYENAKSYEGVVRFGFSTLVGKRLVMVQEDACRVPNPFAEGGVTLSCDQAHDLLFATIHHAYQLQYDTDTMSPANISVKERPGRKVENPTTSENPTGEDSKSSNGSATAGGSSNAARQLDLPSSESSTTAQALLRSYPDTWAGDLRVERVYGTLSALSLRLDLCHADFEQGSPGSRVYFGRLAPNAPLAVKLTKCRRRYQRELNAFRMAGAGAHLVQVLGTWDGGGVQGLLMEKLYAVDYKAVADSVDVLVDFAQTALVAVADLHRKGVAHCDLKPGAFMSGSSRGRTQFKLMDLDNALVAESSTGNRVTGTHPWCMSWFKPPAAKHQDYTALASTLGWLIDVPGFGTGEALYTTCVYEAEALQQEWAEEPPSDRPWRCKVLLLVLLLLLRFDLSLDVIRSVWMSSCWLADPQLPALLRGVSADKFRRTASDAVEEAPDEETQDQEEADMTDQDWLKSDAAPVASEVMSSAKEIHVSMSQETNQFDVQETAEQDKDTDIPAIAVKAEQTTAGAVKSTLPDGMGSGILTAPAVSSAGATTLSRRQKDSRSAAAAEDVAMMRQPVLAGNSVTDPPAGAKRATEDHQAPPAASNKENDVPTQVKQSRHGDNCARPVLRAL